MTHLRRRLEPLARAKARGRARTPRNVQRVLSKIEQAGISVEVLYQAFACVRFDGGLGGLLNAEISARARLIDELTRVMTKTADLRSEIAPAGTEVYTGLLEVYTAALRALASPSRHRARGSEARAWASGS